MSIPLRVNPPTGVGQPWLPSLYGVWDDFVYINQSGTADISTWRKVGTSSTVVLANNQRASNAKAGPGVVILASDTTNQAALGLNGESFRLVRGKKLWCGIRAALQDISATQFFFGLSLDDQSFLAGQPSDYMGFFNVDADKKINVTPA